MINYIASVLQRPGRGWDPVGPEHARDNAEIEWAHPTSPVLDHIENRIGGLERKRVLDLGGGPAQYSIGFAQRRAIVTRHDVSRAYRDIAEHKARDHGVNITFSLGYLEAAAK
jgi:2-polyprenyl-3-methyl-5-hydroxy-6-metoxy-1,4-benzoquinol methylase